MVVAASGRRVRAVTRWAVPSGPVRRLLAVEALLGLVALLVPRGPRDLLALTMAVIGIVAMGFGLRRHRPTPLIGWWVLFASAMTTFAAACAVHALPRGSAVPGALFMVTHVLVIAGLALVGRPAGRNRGCADLLDAAVVAAALFPLLWVLVIAPALSAEGVSMTWALVFPFANLLTMILAVRLVFAGGLRHRAAVWLLLGAGSLLALNISLLVGPLLHGAAQPNIAAALFWVGHPVAFGLAGLRPSHATSATGSTDTPQPQTAISLPRLVLLGALAMVVPLVCVVAYYRSPRGGLTWADYNALAFLGPLVLVAFVLVGRLAIIARLAQRRATELGRQARALAEAAQAQETLQQQLTYRALHDPLTGLANRVVLAERVEWALSRRTGTGQHALLLLDLDEFKDVNDDLGHPIGDEVLIAAAHRLLGLVSHGGTVARLGGDEFAVLLEDVDGAQAAAAAEEILAAMRRPFDISAGQLFLTTSIGLLLAETADGQTTASTALRDADLALNAAKRAGKDRIVAFQSALREARLGHSRLSAGLRRAITNGEFTVHYQPLVDLTTRQTHAVEALVRWIPPEGTPVSPADFIPVAEETGLIREIGAWVLRRACQDARAWYAAAGVAVSVNVSGRQLVEPGFADTVIDAIAEAGLPGPALILEITETSLIAAATVSTAAAQLNELRKRGIRVAIDDFGTGYSSLSYLAQLPVDILKIDSSFTRHGERLDFGPDDWPFARAIVALGHGLNLTTVAEGIETVEQAEALRGLRCQLAQGYLFSRPVPAEAIDALISVPLPPDPETAPQFRIAPHARPAHRVGDANGNDVVKTPDSLLRGA
ncbi:diguanylate cyclase (GGDEF) domain-containing protein [Micromonospora pattaloongensis]|uniref:Diguanylate cyclase (GGDEF) domain-containing protein n=1 Tax=Micromonospora pattaloongensis TaxID=405436 RepID=A0A1H3MVH5_9ACTN|nr:bifunctional diguanylate cyclase/phosphodiesterase [Micromonospora pattaloongensis]SDY80494.1 diguanylate cyclase (GGDEF) domain-containing protein [Micromonospora pattaloongensis]